MARDTWCTRSSGRSPPILAVPAPDSLRTVLYDPSVPVKVTTRTIGTALRNQHVQCDRPSDGLTGSPSAPTTRRKNLGSNVPPLSDGTQQSIRRGSRVVRRSCTLTSEPYQNQWRSAEAAMGSVPTERVDPGCCSWTHPPSHLNKGKYCYFYNFKFLLFSKT